MLENTEKSTHNVIFPPEDMFVVLSERKDSNSQEMYSQMIKPLSDFLPWVLEIGCTTSYTINSAKKSKTKD